MEQVIDLSANRTVVLSDRKHQYSFTLARIGASQWLKYFESVVSTSEQQGGSLVRTFDNSKARLDLVESALVSATGYAGRPIEELTEWKSLLPLSHRMAIANLLLDVKSIDPDEDDAITLGSETVRLQAVWSANDQGQMQSYSNLVHRFRTPTWEHQRKFQRAGARSKVVGGSRSGKTVWMGAQRELASLYDELIQSVSGYCSGFDQLQSTDRVIQEMDVYHKVAAAEQLFTPAQVGDGEESTQ